MTDQHVGTSKNQTVGLKALAGYGLQGMFTTPVQRDDDHSLRVLSFDGADSHQQRVERLLADARLLRQVAEVLKGQPQRGYKPHLPWIICQ